MIHKTFENLPEKKRKTLLQAAFSEFTETGYEKSSINRILADAGIPKGSFYQYFDRKEDLLNACMDVIASNLLHYKVSENHPLIPNVFAESYTQVKTGFFQDLEESLNEQEKKMIRVLLEVPESVRSQGMSHLAEKWIEPAVRKELQTKKELEGQDLDYLAYLISKAETLSLNYVIRNNLPIEAALSRTYYYLLLLNEGMKHLPGIR